MTGARIYLEQRRRTGDGTWHRVGFFHGIDLAVEDTERRRRGSPDFEYRLVEFAETGREFRHGTLTLDPSDGCVTFKSE